jgi:hypothetical protein
MGQKLLEEWGALGFNRMFELLLWAVAAGSTPPLKLLGRGLLKE